MRGALLLGLALFAGCGDVPDPCAICTARQQICKTTRTTSANGVPTYTYYCLVPTPVAEVPQGLVSEPPPAVEDSAP